MSSSVQARLQEREEARKAEVARRRGEREEGRREEETVAYFTDHFTARKAAIEELLASAVAVPPDRLSTHFEKISVECQAVQKFVSNSSLFITSYDLRSAQQQMSQLVMDVSQKQDALMPKKKFAFSSRKKASTQVPSQTPPTAPAAPGGTEGGTTVAMRPESCVGFRQRDKEILEMIDGEVKGHDVNLSHLFGCEVRIYGCPSTLHMSHLTDCRVVCGPVSSSVFVEDCKNCTFVVACQQLRVHTTVHSHIYLHVSSSAVIEDSSDLLFAPYNFSYPQLLEHFQSSGLDREKNNWNKVDDFNWLSSRDPSPNWSVLPDEDRTSHWS